jgi:hypothetical protein
LKEVARHLEVALDVVQGCCCGAAWAVAFKSERRPGRWLLQNSRWLVTGQVGGLSSEVDGSMSG